MQHRYSLLAYLLTVLFICLASFWYYPKWKQSGTEAVISWDVSGYYYYLPAIFVYGDLKQLSFRDDIQSKYLPASSFYQAFQHSNGDWVMKYSCGMAVQYLPFFLVGHGVAKMSSFPADGFSLPYQMAIGWGSLLVAFIGLWFVRKNLLLFFSDTVTALVLLILVLATNYLDYSAFNGAMTHNYLFTIYALLIWQSHRFYEQASAKRAIWIGLLVGVAALTRPTEIISCLIPLLWGLASFSDLKERLGFWQKHLGFLLLSVAACLVVGSLQLIYWKYVSGDWIVYSYGDQGFSWLHPHIKDCLLSYRAGWWVYTPIMVLVVPGFFFLYRYAKSVFWAVLLFSLLFTYIAFAWDIWWYGGSLGQRSMVQAYAVLAFPLAAFLRWVFSHAFTRVVILALVLTTSVHNLWWTHQAHKGGLFFVEQMTRSYYWEVLFKSKKNLPEDVYKLLDTKDWFEGEKKNVQTLVMEDFEGDTLAYNCAVPAIHGQHSVCVGPEMPFSPATELSAAQISGNWITASADIRCTQKEWEVWKMHQLIIEFYHQDQQVKSSAIRVFRLLNENESKRIHFDCEVPAGEWDKVRVFFWNAESQKSLAIDDMKVESFEG